MKRIGELGRRWTLFYGTVNQFFFSSLFIVTYEVCCVLCDLRLVRRKNLSVDRHDWTVIKRNGNSERKNNPQTTHYPGTKLKRRDNKVFSTYYIHATTISATKYSHGPPYQSSRPRTHQVLFKKKKKKKTIFLKKENSEVISMLPLQHPLL
jgi:hypothetical protein